MLHHFVPDAFRGFLFSTPFDSLGGAFLDVGLPVFLHVFDLGIGLEGFHSN